MKKILFIPLLLATWFLPVSEAQMTLEDYLKTLPELDADTLKANQAQFEGKRTVEISYKYTQALKTPEPGQPGNLSPAKYLKSVTIPGGGPKGYAWEQFIRDPQGKPLLIAYTDNAGHLMRGPYVWAACLCSYSPEGQLTAITYLDTAKHPMMVSDGYEPIRIIFGWSTDSQSPVCITTATQGYATLQFTYDHLKRISSISFLDKDGNKTGNSLGYAEERIAYGEPGGCIARREYFDKDGNPVRTVFGYHAVIYNYLLPPGVNELNNHLAEGSGPQERFKKELGGINGSSRQASSRVSLPALATASLLTRIHYLDEHKNPTKHILGHSFIKFEYDAAGEPLKTIWLDAQENPVENAWGFAAIRYDRTRYLTKTTCLDKSDNPVLCTGGFATQSIEYDIDGQLKETAFFGKDGKELAMGPGGWARQTFTYKLVQGKKALASIAYFDNNDTKIIIPNGYHIQRMEYDGGGRLVRQTFEGANDNLLFGPEGYASAKYTYIKSGNEDRLLSIEYFDPENSPCYNRDGISKIYYEYDKNGKCSKHVFCDTDGSIGSTPWSYASMELKFNREGRETKRDYLNGSGLPCYGPEQAASILRTYDSKNRLIGTEYRTASGGEALTPGRYTKVTRKYGKNGLDFSVEYEGGTINPSNLNSEGYYKRSIAWRNEKNNADYIEQFTDAQDNPVMVRNLYATRNVKLSPDGSSGSETFLDAAGKEVPGNRYIYPGVTPHLNRMAFIEETSRRLFLKLPGKRMEDFSPFGLLKSGAHYGEEISSTNLIEIAYPILLDRIPLGMVEGTPDKKYNERGQLSRIDHPYPTDWNFTREEFVYDSSGNLIKRILSSPDNNKRKAIKSDKPVEDAESAIQKAGERGKASDPGRAGQKGKEDSPFGSVIPDGPPI